MFENIFDPFYLEKLRAQQEQQASLTRPASEYTTPEYAGMSEPERQSWLDNAYESSLGGLSYIGKVLDKTFGGRAVRGALGGSPEELLSIIPMSDTLGITDYKNEVSGRQLLDQTGLTTQGDDSWANTIAGVGAEILLDPSTYMTFGASTAAGQAAKRAGTATKGLAPSIRAGERGLVGFGLPFQQPMEGLIFGARKPAGVVEEMGDIGKYYDLPTAAREFGLGDTATIDDVMAAAKGRGVSRLDLENYLDPNAPARTAPAASGAPDFGMPTTSTPPAETVDDIIERINSGGDMRKADGTGPGGVERRATDELSFGNPVTLTKEAWERGGNVEDLKNIEKYGETIQVHDITNSAGEVVGELQLVRVGDDLHVPLLAKTGVPLGQGSKLKDSEKFGADQMFRLIGKILDANPDVKRVVQTPSVGRPGAGKERVYDRQRIADYLAKRNARGAASQSQAADGLPKFSDDPKVNAPNPDIPGQTRQVLTPEQEKAVKRFSNFGAYTFNKGLRQGLNWLDPDGIEALNHLKAAADAAPILDKPITVFRGIDFKFIDDKAARQALTDNLERSLKTGEPIEFKEFQSSSTRPTGVSEGSDSRFDITVRKGIDAKPYSAKPDEWEMIIPPGQFRVTGKEGKVWKLEQVISDTATPAKTTSAGKGMPADIAKQTKAVDEFGNPLRLFHGTHSAYDEIDPAKFGLVDEFGPAYYMTSDPKFASDFAERIGGNMSLNEAAWARQMAENDVETFSKRLAEHEQLGPKQFSTPGAFEKIGQTIREKLAEAKDRLAKTTPSHPNVRTQFIDARNPLDLSKPLSQQEAAELYRKFVGKEPDGPFTEAQLSAPRRLFEMKITPAVGGSKAIAQRIQELGYDAVRYSDEGGGWAVYDPSRVYRPWVTPGAPPPPPPASAGGALATMPPADRELAKLIGDSRSFDTGFRRTTPQYSAPAADFVEAIPGALGRAGQIPVSIGELLAKPAEWATGVNPVTATANLVRSGAAGLGRALKTHFYTPTKGATTREVQPIAENIYTPGLREYGRPFEQQAADVLVDLDPVLRQGGAKERQALESMRAASEIPADSKPFLDRIKSQYDNTIAELGEKLTKGEIGQAAFDDGIEKARGLRDDTLARIDMQKQWAVNRIASAIDSQAFSQDEIDRLRKSVETIGAMSENAHALRQSKGIVSNTLDDIINYGTTRQLAELPALKGEGLWTAAKRRGAQTMGAYDPSQLQRDELFKNIPGGSIFINDLVRNQDLRKLATDDPEQAAAAVRSLLVGNPNPPKNWPVWGQADRMVDFLSTVDSRYADNAADYFSLDIIHSARAKGVATAKVAAQADAVANVATQTAQPAAHFAKEGRASIPVEELLQKAGFVKGGPGYNRIVNELMGQSMRNNPGTALANPGDLSALALPGKHPREGFSLKGLHVPEDVAADVMRLGEAWRTPAALAPVVEAWKMAMNVFKTGVTAPFPAFNVRNIMNAMFAMWRDRSLDFGAMGAARAVQNGGFLPEAIAAKAYPGLSVEAATEAFKKELVATQTAYTRFARQATGDIVGLNTDNITTSMLPNTTGTASTEWENLKGFIGGYAPTAEGREKGFGTLRQLFDPTLVEGGLTNKNYNRFVDQGRKFGGAAEDWIRSSHFLSKKMQGYATDVASDAVKKYHIDYANITPTERMIKGIVPWYGFCVPLSHEILTRNGWKHREELSVGDEVLGYDLKTGEHKWEPLEAIHEFDHDGPLMRMESRGAEFFFTPEHRWPSHTARHFVKGKWYGGEKICSLGRDLNSSDRIPIKGQYRGTESVLSPRHAAIVGWVVTDGSMRWRANHCEMVVYQAAHKFVDEIRELLGTDPRDAVDNRQFSPVYTFPVAREDVVEITKHFTGKHCLVQLIGKLSREALDAMYDAMMMAEGTNIDGVGQQSFSQCPVANPEVSDAFQIICQLTGRSANIRENGSCMYLRKCNYMYPMHWLRPSFEFKGKVWCPQTPSGFWVMRHNGAVCITGNSRGNLPPILEDLVTQPAKVASAVRLTAGGRDKDQFAPGYIAEGASLPFFGAPEGHARFLSSFGLGIEDEAFKMLGSALHGDIKRTVGAGFGMVNPYMKAIPEQAFGMQFYSGRNLADLQPSTTVSLGGLIPQRTAQTLTQFFANTPAARVISTADRAMDTRKWDGSGLLNLATGVRVSDIDLERTKAAAQREWLQQQLRPAAATSVREEVYVPAEKRGQLNPADQFMLDQLMGIQKKQSAAARERREAAR